MNNFDFEHLIKALNVQPIKGYYDVMSLADYVLKYNDALVDHKELNAKLDAVPGWREDNDPDYNDIIYNHFRRECTKGEPLDFFKIEAILLDLGYVRRGDTNSRR